MLFSAFEEPKALNRARGLYLLLCQSFDELGYFYTSNMRQRPNVHPIPPRSADNDNDLDCSQWPDNKRNQARQRNNYQLSLGDLIQEPRAVSKRNVYKTNSGDGLSSPNMDDNAGTVSNSTPDSGTRRRRVTGTYQRDDNSKVHSPQHYSTENSYENQFNDTAHYGQASAPRSADSSYLYPSYSQSQRDFKHAASEAFYAQYGSNYAAHQHDARPTLFRQHSVPPSNAHKLSFQHFESTFHLDPNPIAALHFRKALHVPDKDYRSFLPGGKLRDVTPTFHPVCCANVCAGFSFVGFIFFIFIGVLLDTQPLFIAGTLPAALKENDNGKTTTIYFVTAERLPMASNAYQASYAYILTMLACLVYAHFERLNSAIKRRSYQDVPDAEGSTAGVVGDDSLPDYHDDQSHPASPAYQMSPWNRLVSAASKSTVKLREWAVAATARAWAGGTKRKTRKKTCAKTI